jgi:hypothetical protein
MNRSRLCVATLTWARDDAEEQLLRRALEVLAESSSPTFVANRPAREQFAEFLLRRDGLTTVQPHAPGLLGQVRASLNAALEAGRDVILYTEPDKEDFIRTGLTAFVDCAPDESDVGVVFAGRSAQSLATFPPVQRYTEGVINQLWERCGGPSGDYSYGPMLLRANLVRSLDRIEADIGWGWRHFIAGAASRLGYRIAHCVADYPCPRDQQAEDDADRLHRMSQLAENIRGLILSRTVSIAGRIRDQSGGVT